MAGAAQFCLGLSVHVHVEVTHVVQIRQGAVSAAGAPYGASVRKPHIQHRVAPADYAAETIVSAHQRAASAHDDARAVIGVDIEVLQHTIIIIQNATAGVCEGHVAVQLHNEIADYAAPGVADTAQRLMCGGDGIRAKGADHDILHQAAVAGNHRSSKSRRNLIHHIADHSSGRQGTDQIGGSAAGG